MALDTNLTPEVVNSYNTYINGNKAIGVTSEISMPTITSETIDVSGTGILGKISAPNIGQFESIEQEITFNLIYSSFVDMLSPKRQVNLTIRAAQQAVDKNLGYAYKGLRIVEVGRVKEFTPGKIKPGEGMEAGTHLPDDRERRSADYRDRQAQRHLSRQRRGYAGGCERADLKSKRHDRPGKESGRSIFCMQRKEKQHGKECFYRS